MEHLYQRSWKTKKGISKAWVYRYTDLNGKERKKEFGTHKPTAEELSKLVRTISYNPKFKDFTENYIHNVRTVNCKESTIETYDTYLQVNLRLLWNKKIKDFKDTDILNWLISLEEEGKSEKTRSNILSFVNSVFKYAIRQGIILKNPAEDIHVRKIQKKKPKALNHDEIKVFEEIVDGTPNHLVNTLRPCEDFYLYCY